MSVFSERVSSLMKEKKMTQKQLAVKSNVTESSMTHYIKGSRIPYGEVVVRIANALDTSTDYLLGNTDNAKSDFENLSFLQRKVGEMDEKQLKKAESVLKAVFEELFEDEDD